MEIKVVYICKFKITGFPIAFLSEEMAKAWVAIDPEWRYYDAVPVEYNH